MGRTYRENMNRIKTADAQPLSLLTVLIVLALTTLLIYANTFFAPFQFDDSFNITGNPKIRHLTSYLTFSGTRDTGFFSFAINYALGGVNTFGYHLVNTLIHIFNGFLVYTLALLLIAATFTTKPANSSWIALAAALLFVVHPVQTQSVTYIVQRFSSLVTTFYLLSIVCYLKWRISAPDVKYRTWWYVAALCSCILAMKTKENAFTLPIMLVMVEWIFFREHKWTALIPFLLTLPYIPFATHPSSNTATNIGLPNDVPLLSRTEYLFTQFRVIVTYLGLLVLPINQSLDHDFTVYRSFMEAPVLASFLLLSLLAGLAIILLRRSAKQPPDHMPDIGTEAPRLIAFGILWFFLALSIESSIIPIKDVIFEHRIYLPSIGFFIAICFWGAWIWDRKIKIRWFIILLAVIMVGGYSVATVQRNQVWKDPISLWGDVVRKSPNKARGHIALAVALRADHRLDDAMREFQTALKLNPEYPAGIHANMGVVYNMRGRLDDAIREYQTALKLNPNDPDIHSNLGVAYRDQGRIEDAAQEYLAAITLNPKNAEAHSNLGLVYRTQGRLDDAIQEYQTALRINPDFASAHDNLGVAYLDQGKIKDAIQECQTAIRLNPDYAEGHNNLGSAYARQGKIDLAIQEFWKAVQLQPNFAIARYNLGGAYQSRGMLSEARTQFEQILKTKPDFTEARQALEALSKTR